MKKLQTTADNCAEDCSMAKELKYYCTKLHFLTWRLGLKLSSMFHFPWSPKKKKDTNILDLVVIHVTLFLFIVC